MTLPTITALPTPPNRASSPSTFASDADAFLGALPTFRTELNAFGVALNTEAVGEWETLGSDVATTSGSSVGFNNIPATYRDLRFQFNGVSPSTTANLRIEVSADGVNYSAPATLVTSAGNADTVRGDIIILDYKAATFALRSTLVNQSVGPVVTVVAGVNMVATVPGTLTHVRFSVSTGNLDAGAIRLRVR